MILGTGDIGSILKDHPDRLYFASGVSNSQEHDRTQFDREVKLLLAQPRHLQIVYFSSLSIYYSSSDYAKHKINMENLIKKEFPRYSIIRLGNITWGKNPNTFINYFKSKIKGNESFYVHDSYRYIINQEELLHWVGLCPDFNTEMNITGERVKVEEVVNRIKNGKI